jgi:hypothetical protein
MGNKRFSGRIIMGKSAGRRPRRHVGIDGREILELMLKSRVG